MEQVGFDELFYQLRKCHHKAVELNECQEVIMARHLLDHCVIYLKPAKNTEQQVQPDSASDNVIPIPVVGKMAFRFGAPRRLT